MIARPEKTLLMLVLFAVVAFTAVGARSAVPVGQIASKQAVVDGVELPQGSTLFTQSLVTTGDEPVAVRLTSGQVIGVADGSTARFEQGPQGGISVAVVSGSVGFQESDGEAVLLAEGNSAVFDQIEDGVPIGGGQRRGHVWEGEEKDDDEEIAICHLKDQPQADEIIVLCSTDPDDLSSEDRDRWAEECDFERMKVEWRVIPDHLGHADVFADKDMRSDSMPDEIECGRKGALWWLTSLLLVPVIEGDDDTVPPAPALSPVVP